MVYRCDSCSRSFPTSTALQTHIASSIHSPRPYCEACIEWFSTEALLKEHLATDPMHRSPTPLTFDSLSFATPGELEEHTQSSIFHRYTIGKFYCDDCVLWFSDQNALDRHLQDAEEHASQFACVDCGREFNNRKELEAHVLMGVLCQYGVGEGQPRDGTPREEDENPTGTHASLNFPQEGLKFIPSTGSHGSYSNDGIEQSYLHECNTRDTDSPAASSQYLHESHPVEGPGSEPQTYHCPGRTCPRIFASPSALLQHLDSGACPSGINRHIVNSATIELDHSSAITNRLLRAATSRNIHEVNPDEEEAGIATRYRAQASPGGPFLTGIGNLDELPDLSCPLCPKSRSPFRTVAALHAHMTSPVHDARIYHCTSTSSGLASNSDAKHVSRNFSTLGALAQHLESKGCVMSVPAGARIFSETVREVQERLREVELASVESRLRLQELEW
ncbi:hypothetical protein EV426DRAFT_608667 [Tirmania nivea]|nr:hypothetical protein EV426DRAFT_608667 [Tirmania nivea]